MSYVVLARKWRPQHFDEVVGQGHVARTLMNSIEQDRVHHAYLFCGTRGVGKTTTARILAKALNCAKGPGPRPCYECDSCREISQGQSVDVFEIDGASNRGINEIRELRDGVRYAPSRDRNKIYIIDEVHMLTTEAFNALLKTLEEPPPHARFIFATTEPQKIPVTILSRCQRFDFKRISLQDIVAHLQTLCAHEKINAEKAALQLVARQANGGMRDALSLLDQIISFAGSEISEAQIVEILGVANRKHLFELSQAVMSRDAGEALRVLDEVDRYGYDVQQFASELVTHFRDLMVTATVKDPEAVTQLTESELELARGQVKGRPTELLHRYFSVMVDGAQKMHRSPYPRLIFEMTVVRLCELEPLVGLDLLVDRLALLESTLEGDTEEVVWPERGEKPAGKPEAGEAPAPKVEEKPAPKVEEKPAPKVEEKPAPKVEEKPAPSVEAQVETEAAVAVAEPPEPAKPMIPQPLQPREAEEIERPDVTQLADGQERWRALVAYLRQKNAPVAAACEYAYVERFEAGEVILHFDDEGMVDLAGEAERTKVIEGTVEELFGERWKVQVHLRDKAAPAAAKTMAQEREEDMARRRDELAGRLRNNPAVQTAQELFSAEDVRVSVRLFDE